MAENIVNVRVQNKYDKEANWKAKDPVLLSGEVVFTSDGNDMGKHKVGNGTAKWSELPYSKAELSKGDVITALGYTPPETSDLSKYLPLSGGALTGALRLNESVYPDPKGSGAGTGSVGLTDYPFNSVVASNIVTDAIRLYPYDSNNKKFVGTQSEGYALYCKPCGGQGGIIYETMMDFRNYDSSYELFNKIHLRTSDDFRNSENKGKTVSLSLPFKDGTLATTDDIPVIADWAKATKKPYYEISEIGSAPKITESYLIDPDTNEVISTQFEIESDLILSGSVDLSDNITKADIDNLFY